MFNYFLQNIKESLFIRLYKSDKKTQDTVLCPALVFILNYSSSDVFFLVSTNAAPARSATAVTAGIA